jgi:hypothetical protein
MKFNKILSILCLILMIKTFCLAVDSFEQEDTDATEYGLNEIYKRSRGKNML